MTKGKLAIKLAIDIMERNVNKYINHGIYEVSDADGAVHVEFGEAINILNGMLEQQPCKDAISRKEVLDILKAEWVLDKPIEEWSVYRDVADLPSVTPTPINVGTVGIISHGRKTLADLVAESEDKE